MDKFAKAEYGNVPVGSIFLASMAQALGVLGAGALQRKYPANAFLAKWGNTVVEGLCAVLVPQTKKYIGEATAKSLAIGLGCQAAAPQIGALINSILYPATPAARRSAGKRVAGAGQQGPPQSDQINRERETDLNGPAAAKDLGSTI